LFAALKIKFNKSSSTKFRDVGSYYVYVRRYSSFFFSAKRCWTSRKLIEISQPTSIDAFVQAVINSGTLLACRRLLRVQHKCKLQHPNFLSTSDVYVLLFSTNLRNATIPDGLSVMLGSAIKQKRSMRNVGMHIAPVGCANCKACMTFFAMHYAVSLR
jgi:hypothetical protein